MINFTNKMPQLHETLMGKKLIEHSIPQILKNLEKISGALEKLNDNIIILHDDYIESINTQTKKKIDNEKQ